MATKHLLKHSSSKLFQIPQILFMVLTLFPNNNIIVHKIQLKIISNITFYILNIMDDETLKSFIESNAFLKQTILT